MIINYFLIFNFKIQWSDLNFFFIFPLYSFSILFINIEDIKFYFNILVTVFTIFILVL